MKIAVAGLQHETNSFAPLPTKRADFDAPGGWPAFAQGAKMGETLRGTGTPMSGALSVADAQKVETLPLLWGMALPSGPVEDAAFEELAGEIVSRFATALTNGAEALYLDLHGAMATPSYPDAEGELIARLRRVAPKPFPIAASFDLHGNISAQMVADLTLLDCYRTYPHTDLRDTGARVMTRLIACLRGTPQPVLAYRAVPYLAPIDEQCTFIEPTATLLSQAEAMIEATQGLEVISQFFGFPLADVPDAGPSVITQAATAELAELAAEQMLTLWQAAEGRFQIERLSPAAAVARAKELAEGPGRGPVMISDTQDNPGGGGTGCTTGLMQAMIAGKATGAVMVHIADAPACAAAHAAGLGGQIDLAIGAANSAEFGEPVPGPWRVLALGDGAFTGVGPMYRGNAITLGPVALLEQAGVRVIVAPRKMQASEPGLLLHLGLTPEDQPIIAVKSSVHFRGAYQDMARAILTAKAPGLVTSDLSALAYRRATRAPARKSEM